MKKHKIGAILNLNENGTKLAPLTDKRPIASLPFGCRYRLIDFPFTSLHSASIESAAYFLTGNGRSLHDHIRSGASWGLDSSIGGGLFPYTETDVRQTSEVEEPGQLSSFYHNQIHYVVRSKSEYIVVMGSKMLCNIDLPALLRYHQEKEADVTIMYKNMPKSTYLANEAATYFTFDKEEQDKITAITTFEQLPLDAETAALSMNIAIMSSEKFIELATQAGKKNENGDTLLLIKDHLNENKVYGYEYTGYLKDIDDIQSYFEANMDMLVEANYNALFNRGDSIITKVKNGAPTFYSKDAKVSNAQFASDCFIEGEVENSLIFRKVTIGKNAQVHHSIVMQGTQIGEGAVLEYVILDKGVRIGAGVHLKGTADEVMVIKKNSVIESKKGV
ncbi:glucose-1-phosphate adenylyltransferase subunit GlgD [Carnobacterium sp.]|uniref:glucose-1-phosphate adenylyltransferase subunit GlgD n=1 Tax=Carnobacterium sp. TaxID=48221 RepID=UPI0028B0E81C|nr:glucose-1-phosphate adenylyltransferase subunit GlgD [Carnobacterium sp.]